MIELNQGSTRGGLCSCFSLPARVPHSLLLRSRMTGTMRRLASSVATVNRMGLLLQTIAVSFLLQGASTSARIGQVAATVAPWPRLEEIYRGEDSFCEMDKLRQNRRVLASGSTGVNSNTSSNETSILLGFRRAVTSDPHGALDSWNATSDPNVCQWVGIKCDSYSRVLLLDLGDHQLEGSISPLLGQLSSLSSILLGGNNFTGPIPSSFGMLPYLRHLDISGNNLNSSIPPEITNCSSLVYLNLSSNYLIGSIPNQFGKLRNISIVSLSYNLFIHSIPRELGNCSSLRHLDLGFNQLTGMIPHELGKLRLLSYLVLSNNTLSGPIPRSVSNLTSLTVLDLHTNNITGPILPELSDLRKLQYLLLYSTGLGGSIPASLGNLSSLLALKLGGFVHMSNDVIVSTLKGRLPPDLGRLKSLSEFILMSANVTGSIPEELGGLSNITTIFITENQLTGHIPPALGNLSTLLTLFLDGNRLSGAIPGSLGGLHNLGWIGLMHNQLTGPIPPEFGNLTKIFRLLLSHNSLSGPVISDLGRLSTIRELGLDYNQFSGELPSTLGNCSLMTQLFLSFNNISGPLPMEMVVSMTALYNLSFTNNQLSGSIPNEIGNMVGLEYLNLSSNNLSGPIPPTIEHCLDLSVLDVSNNHLTGQLPVASLESLLQLKGFSVANNDLEGAIPGPVRAFENVTAASYAGNAGLCGLLLGKSCSSVKTGRCRGIGFTCHRVWIYVGCGAAVVILLGVLIITLLICRRKSDTHDDNMKTLDENGGFRNVAAFPNDLNLTMEELWVGTSGFSELNILGKGGQSTVYKAVVPHGDGTTFAVKHRRLDPGETILTSSHGLCHEVGVLNRLKHRNLVKLHGWCATDKLVALLMEYVPNGTLQLHLHPANKIDGATSEPSVVWLNLQTRMQIAIGVADAMAYLHHECHEPIIHSDLKPSNILLDGDFNPKVADFGIARYVQRGRPSREATVSALYGTVGYIPPEYATSNKVTTSGDVYSYGVVVLEMLTGKQPTDEYFASRGTWLVDWALKAFPNRIADVVDKRLASELEKNDEKFRMLFRVGLLCTRATPGERPSMHDVQRMFTGDI